MLRQPADYFENAALAAERHGAQAQARNKDSGIAELLILHDLYSNAGRAP